MGSAGAVVAAQRARLVREFVSHLREHKAYSRETAVLLRPQRWMGRRTLLALVANGSLISAGADRYWLDEMAFAAAQKRRRGRMMWVLLAVLVLFAASIALAGALRPGGQG